jgi:hypothetical protein
MPKKFFFVVKYICVSSFKSIILATISSHKWQRPILKLNEYNTDEDDEEFIAEQNQTHLFLEDQASSIG